MRQLCTASSGSYRQEQQQVFGERKGETRPTLTRSPLAKIPLFSHSFSMGERETAALLLHCHSFLLTRQQEEREGWGLKIEKYMKKEEEGMMKKKRKRMPIIFLEEKVGESPSLSQSLTCPLIFSLSHHTHTIHSFPPPLPDAFLLRCKRTSCIPANSSLSSGVNRLTHVHEFTRLKAPLHVATSDTVPSSRQYCCYYRYAAATAKAPCDVKKILPGAWGMRDWFLFFFPDQ